MSTIRWFAIFIGMFATTLADTPGIRIYASDAAVKKMGNGEKGKIGTVYRVALFLDVFQTGKYVYSADADEQESLRRRSEKVNLARLVSSRDSWKETVRLEDGSPVLVVDEHQTVAGALQESLSELVQRYIPVNATLFLSEEGQDVRLDLDVTYIQYVADERLLLMEGTTAVDAMPMQPWYSSWNTTEGCGAGYDSDGQLYDCATLGAALEEYEAVLELRLGGLFDNGKFLSDKDKIKECSPRRVAELQCVGKTCPAALGAAGVDLQDDPDSVRYHRLITAEQCCNMLRLCDAVGGAGVEASCDVKKLDRGGDGQYLVLAATMEVGTPGLKGPRFEANCQPSCAPNMGEWGVCRFGRKRCQHDCRCAWWC